jgi:hypothetical protein
MLTVSKTSTYCGVYASVRTWRWMRKNTAGTKMKIGARKFREARRERRSWREVVARRPVNVEICRFALDGSNRFPFAENDWPSRLSQLQALARGIAMLISESLSTAKQRRGNPSQARSGDVLRKATVRN